jgi:hypothetical protein
MISRYGREVVADEHPEASEGSVPGSRAPVQRADRPDKEAAEKLELDLMLHRSMGDLYEETPRTCRGVGRVRAAEEGTRRTARAADGAGHRVRRALRQAVAEGAARVDDVAGAPSRRDRGRDRTARGCASAVGEERARASQSRATGSAIARPARRLRHFRRPTRRPRAALWACAHRRRAVRAVVVVPGAR